MDFKTQTNKVAATRFVEAFNTDDWATVFEVVAPDFVLTHPLAGTVRVGPAGMVEVWAHFKAALPDAWHPIPVMITDGDYLAKLLPTYGNFTGQPHQGTPPTGNWLEYGMVNIVRLEGGKLAEAWFGMDPLVELQQMGALPTAPPRQLSAAEAANVERFQRTVNPEGLGFDTLTAIGDVVIAAGPPQQAMGTRQRKVEVYRSAEGSLEPVYTHEFATHPPYAGDPTADTELSRAVVERFFDQVLRQHDLDALADIASPDILIHPTAMPCESSFYGIGGAADWLGDQWRAFPDLALSDTITVAQRDIVAVHWTAQGSSKGRFRMLPPTGQPVDFTGLSMYRIEDGQIAEIWDTRNTLSIVRQLNPEMVGHMLAGGGHHGAGHHPMPAPTGPFGT